MRPIRLFLKSTKCLQLQGGGGGRGTLSEQVAGYLRKPSRFIPEARDASAREKTTIMLEKNLMNRLRAMTQRKGEPHPQVRGGSESLTHLLPVNRFTCGMLPTGAFFFGFRNTESRPGATCLIMLTLRLDGC